MKFLNWKNSFLTPRLQRMLCNFLMQPDFDYACSAWYPNLNVKLKKMKIMQDKCIHFYLKLDKMHYISEEDFKTINWLPIDQRAQQNLNVTVFKYVTNAYPYYKKEFFGYASQGRINSRNNYAWIKVPFRKTTMEQKSLSYIGPQFWKNCQVQRKETLA